MKHALTLLLLFSTAAAAQQTADLRIEATSPETKLELSVTANGRTFKCAQPVTQSTPCTLKGAPVGQGTLTATGSSNISLPLKLDGNSKLSFEHRSYLWSIAGVGVGVVGIVLIAASDVGTAGYYLGAGLLGAGTGVVTMDLITPRDMFVLKPDATANSGALRFAAAAIPGRGLAAAVSISF